jgi:hypothetical protein
VGSPSRAAVGRSVPGRTGRPAGVGPGRRHRVGRPNPRVGTPITVDIPRRPYQRRPCVYRTHTGRRSV